MTWLDFLCCFPLITAKLVLRDNFLYSVSDTLETVLLLSKRSSLKRDFKPSKHIFTFENVLESCVYVTRRLCICWDSETIVLLENKGKKTTVLIFRKSVRKYEYTSVLSKGNISLRQSAECDNKTTELAKPSC